MYIVYIQHTQYNMKRKITTVYLCRVVEGVLRKTALDFNFNASTPYTYNINKIDNMCIDIRTQLQLGTEIMTSAVSSLV